MKFFLLIKNRVPDPSHESDTEPFYCPLYKLEIDEGVPIYFSSKMTLASSIF